MAQGCRALLEPKWAGIHDLMVRLLGRCTCDTDARVVELYQPTEVPPQREPVDLPLASGGAWPWPFMLD